MENKMVYPSVNISDTITDMYLYYPKTSVRNPLLVFSATRLSSKENSLIFILTGYSNLIFSCILPILITIRFKEVLCLTQSPIEF